jgi:phosphate transport system substrate-binding protein
MMTRASRLLLSCLCCGFAAFASISPAAAQITVTLCSKKEPGNTARRLKGLFLIPNVVTLPDGTQFWNMLLENGARMNPGYNDYVPCQDTVGTPSAPIAAPQEPAVQPSKAPAWSPRPPREPQTQAQKLIVSTLDRSSRETLTMRGSGTISRGVMPKIIEAFAAGAQAKVKQTAVVDTVTYDISDPQTGVVFLQIVVQAAGSKMSLSPLRANQVQVGLSSSPYSDDEVRALMAASGAASRAQIEHVVALDGIAMIVPPTNPTASIGLCDVARIYAGKLKRWSDLGGPHHAIDAQLLEGSSGTEDVFEDAVLQNCGEKFDPALQRQKARYNQVELKKAVQDSPWSLGFVGRSELTPTFKTLNVGGACGIDLAPTTFNIKSEDYPLSRRLFVYTPYRVTANAQAFLDFLITSSAAQEALKDGETTDLTIERAPGDDRAYRYASLPENRDSMIQQFASDTRALQRASVTFRFEFGADVLDAKARADVSRLAAYLRANPAQRVLLAGFTDSVGRLSDERLRAMRRANAVRTALLTIEPSLARIVEVQGYGKILPVMCNDTPLGAQKNRRVEVWLGN